MSTNNSSSSSGIGFTGLLTIAFIVLKLCNVINWDWVWVLSPIWGSVALWLTVLIGALSISILSSSNKKYTPPPIERKKSSFAQKMEEALEKQRHAQSN